MEKFTVSMTFMTFRDFFKLGNKNLITACRYMVLKLLYKFEIKDIRVLREEEFIELMNDFKLDDESKKAIKRWQHKIITEHEKITIFYNHEYEAFILNKDFVLFDAVSRYYINMIRGELFISSNSKDKFNNEKINNIIRLMLNNAIKGDAKHTLWSVHSYYTLNWIQIDAEDSITRRPKFLWHHPYETFLNEYRDNVKRYMQSNEYRFGIHS